ncbi:MAG TPA: hypothetical protein VGF48_14005 [Thermoanaerobaculia bacterium]|jgi:hypothetical protein
MTDRLERFVAGAVIAISLWMATSWLLAMTLALTRRNLLIALAVLIVASLPLVRRPVVVPITRWTVIAAILIAGWTAFILWRGSVVPPLSYDAMTYHFPKAALLVQHEGYTHLDSHDLRLRSFPANYELLVADLFLLTGSDRFADWIGTVFYLLFLAATAVVGRRWWGPGLHVVACVLGAGGAPLILLHSGADKNDLMTAFFAVMAIYWSARWCAEGGATPAALAILCGVLAIGTKLSAATIFFGVAPFGLVALIRRPPRPRWLLASIAFSAIALLLLGGWVFVMNATAPPMPGAKSGAAAAVPTAQYSEWQNLWQLPTEIVQASLGLRTARPWPKHDLFVSHFGVLFGIALLALPFCIWRYRSTGERTIASVAAVIAFLMLLPIHQVGFEQYAAILRYSMFVLPFVLAWTVAPVVRELLERRPIWAHGIATLLALTFLVQAIDIAANDTFAPIEYVRWAAANPGTREGPHVRNRAAFIADQLAGPHDTIAVFGGVDVWIYPAYGRQFTRRVIRLASDATVAEVPDDAQWLLIDDPPPYRKRPSEGQLRFFREAERDPRWVLRLRHRGFNQAVFQRVAK